MFRRQLTLPEHSSCVTAARVPCGRFAAGFFEPISEHGFGMIGCPLVGQHLVETWIVVVQAEQQLAQVGPRLDAVTLGAGEDREQDRPPAVPACWLPRNSQFFLPIAW